MKATIETELKESRVLGSSYTATAECIIEADTAESNALGVMR